MIREFIKYNLVGVINTLVGFGIIFILMFLGVNPILSNAIGY
ncbi:MAG: GtrA family protein, partial [Epsilonproteobacteria bacterium]|nr:GtrA family protein [Campylobacterota bacterium]